MCQLGGCLRVRLTLRPELQVKKIASICGWDLAEDRNRPKGSASWSKKLFSRQPWDFIYSTGSPGSQACLPDSITHEPILYTKSLSLQGGWVQCRQLFATKWLVVFSKDVPYYKLGVGVCCWQVGHSAWVGGPPCYWACGYSGHVPCPHRDDHYRGWLTAAGPIVLSPQGRIASSVVGAFRRGSPAHRGLPTSRLL